MKYQLCCYCKNFYSCDWSKHGKPIPGWEATPNVIKCTGEREIKSYNIKSCPLFERDRFDILDITEFCKQEGINYRTFIDWIKNYKYENKFNKNANKYKEHIIYYCKKLKEEKEITEMKKRELTNIKCVNCGKIICEEKQINDNGAIICDKCGSYICTDCLDKNKYDKKLYEFNDRTLNYCKNCYKNKGE